MWRDGKAQGNALPSGLVPRARLIEALASSQIGLVEAGAGYGKSVLARQYERHLGIATAAVVLDSRDDTAEVFLASLGRALTAQKLSDLAAVTDVNESSGGVDRFLSALAETDTPLLVVLDDAHFLTSPDVERLVLRLARNLPGRHRLLVTARKLPAGMNELRMLPNATTVDNQSMEFTLEEASELLRIHLGRQPSGREVRMIYERSLGWATALVLAAASTALGAPEDMNDIASTGGQDPVVFWLRTISERLSPTEFEAVVQLSHLPYLSVDVASAATGNERILDRMIEVGVPLARTQTGSWEIPDPVSSYFQGISGLDEGVALRSADVYQRAGETLIALRTLLQVGLDSDAARMLGDLAPDNAEDFGLATLRDLIDRMADDAIDRYPRPLLHFARVSETVHRTDLRIPALERALEIVGDGERHTDGPRLRREIDAERARDLVWDERSRKEASKIARSVVDHAGPDEMTARLRALDVLGRLASWFSSEGPKPEAEALLQESARLAGRLGQRTWSAQASIALAMGFYFALCRFDRALSTIDEVLSELPARSRYRALVQSFRGDVLVELGRYAEAEASIDEMREIGTACREEWALAYAGWTEAELASYMGDLDRTVAAVIEADSHRDVWYEQASGVEFLACVSDYLDKAGAHEMATEYLARAKERMAGCERPVRVSEAAVLGRSGDPKIALETIGTLLADPEICLEPQERWPILLLRAYAALRGGEPDVEALAYDAFETCSQFAHPEGPFLRERVAAEVLLPYAVRAGSRAATALQNQSGKVAVTIFGRFELRRGSELLSLPPGRPTLAVKAVSAAGGRLHAEELQEMLWPDTDNDVGRNRLRNLLSRLKVAVGDVLVRDREYITLAPEAQCDWVTFDSLVREALAGKSLGDSALAASAARRALALYRGDLLQDDRMQWWSTGPRERAKNRFLQLLDLLATDAERRGETDESVRLLERAIEVEPYDEARYLRLARLFASQGRTGSATAILVRCRESLAEVGVRPSASLESTQRDIETDLR